MENYGILLVDDEPAYCSIVTALLETWGGRVDCASDTAGALTAVATKRYDLILVDINMGEEDGYRTVAEMRRGAEWARTVPILAFTTTHLAGGERHYIDAGFDGWLPKPFRAAELNATLRYWIGADLVGRIAGPPASKLAELLGSDAAAAMVDRFHASLADGIADLDAGGDKRAVGHRLGGLAGTLGFPVLSAAWLSLEDGDSAIWPTVKVLTQEAIARHSAGGANVL